MDLALESLDFDHLGEFDIDDGVIIDIDRVLGVQFKHDEGALLDHFDEGV